MQKTHTGQLIFLLCKCSAEILRHRRQETHRLPGDRVGKFQLEGMQRLAFDNAVIRIVEKISWKRVPDVLHVHPNLVGTTGFQVKFD